MRAALILQPARAHQRSLQQQPCGVQLAVQQLRRQNICSRQTHICRAAENDRQAQLGQSAELYEGESSDNQEKAIGASEGSEEDEDTDEEEERHGLEELGDPFQGPLTDMQEKYKAKLAAKLQQEKEQQQIEEEARSGTFNQGKRAYEKGRYQDSVVLFEKALNDEGWMSRLGGEIQMWLALAYQIEETNPLKKVQQQAANLRFILQAPKLKRGPDEVVNIPVLQIEERKKIPGRRYVRPPVPVAVIERKRKRSLEEQFWDNYTPPKWTQNRYVWWASGVLGVCLAIYSATAGR